MQHLTEMSIFAKVVEAKSFSGAARNLKLTKSAVSKQVSRLEQALGARLLNRTTRTLSLTEAGGAVYEHCARIVSAAEAAELAASQLAAAPRGILKLSAPVTFGKMHVAPAVPEFLRRYPDVAVQISLLDRIVDLAEEGYDLAIRLTQKPGENLVARKLATIRYVICGSPDYFARAGLPKKPEDLAGHNCVSYGSEGFGERWQFEGPQGRVAVKVRGNFQINSSEAIRQTLLDGIGIALVPTLTVGADLQSGALKMVMKRYRPVGPFSSEAYAVYLPNRQLSPKVRAFIDFLVERFGKVPYWDAAPPAADSPRRP